MYIPALHNTSIFVYTAKSTFHPPHFPEFPHHSCVQFDESPSKLYYICNYTYGGTTLKKTGTNYRTARDMREKLYWLVTPSADDSGIEKFYDYFMIGTIIISIIPLCFHRMTPFFRFIDLVTVSIFIFDYIARWITIDYEFEDAGLFEVYLEYPFRPMAIIDLVAIIPSLSHLNPGFKLLRFLRLFRVMRVVRLFKAFRYYKSIELVTKVLRRHKTDLMTVFGFVIAYIFTTALIVFQIEPHTFRNFFDALYWSTITLTTVGYGDIHAVSTVGKLITMLSTLMGALIIALPAAIMTAGFMEELEIRRARRKKKDE